jgi:hypothetical protein
VERNDKVRGDVLRCVSDIIAHEVHSVKSHLSCIPLARAYDIFLEVDGKQSYLTTVIDCQVMIEGKGKVTFARAKVIHRQHTLTGKAIVDLIEIFEKTIDLTVFSLFFNPPIILRAYNI